MDKYFPYFFELQKIILIFEGLFVVVLVPTV